MSLWIFGTPLFPLPTAPEKKNEKKTPKRTDKKQGAGRVLFFDTLFITLVVSGPPFGGLVCLRKCFDDVVDCSCESAGQSVYGPRICFLGPFDPFRCKTIVVLLVVVWPVVSDMPIYDGFLDMYVFCMLHVSYVIRPVSDLPQGIQW
jgi:hypothetical protein